MKYSITFLFILLLLPFKGQVGINNTSPHPSAALDIQSGISLQGLLVPRMTTTDRNSIANPAESLLVFDTTFKSFFYYNTSNSSWMKIANESALNRNNYKLVKSAADLSAELASGGGSRYLLNTDTYYEINGTIILTNPIDLNNAYISGLDANEDILSFTGGVVFKGNTGGSIRNLTLTGAKAFEITGPGIATNSSLLVQNTIIENTTTGVGSISGIGLYFSNIVNFISNANGITYSNIGNLLLNTQGWTNSNNGTFETFTGNFGHIQKASGFSTVNGSDIAIDVSNAALNVGTGILQGTVFSGTTTSPSGYVRGYAVGSSYPGYYFNTAWTVDAPGIPKESDDAATGDINLSAAVGTGATTTFSGTGSSSRKKISGTTTSNNLFRFTRDGDNIITYRGNKPRYFQVAASVSYQGNSDLTVILYIAKNGTVITETKVYGKGTTGLFTTSGILALPIIGTVQLKKDDFVEIWAERYEGTGNMQTVSLNLIVR